MAHSPKRFPSELIGSSITVIDGVPQRIEKFESKNHSEGGIEGIELSEMN